MTVVSGASVVVRTSWVGTVLLHAEVLNLEGILLGASPLALVHRREITGCVHIAVLHAALFFAGSSEILDL